MKKDFIRVSCKCLSEIPFVSLLSRCWRRGSVLRVNLALFVLALSQLLLIPDTLAVYSNYNSVLIGEQAAGMAGAYTALFSDASAESFYNPGALGFVKAKSMSASTSVFKKIDTKYGEYTDFTTASLRVNQGFFHGIPAASGSITNFHDWICTLSIMVPDYDTFNGEVRSTSDSVSLLSYNDETLWVGGSVSHQVSETDSVGISLYYTARNFTRSVRERRYPSTSSAVLASEEKTIHGNSVVAILGYLRRFDQNWSFGIAFRPPSLRVAGNGSYFQSKVETNPYSTTNLDIVDEKTHTKIPFKINSGIAYTEPEHFTISADISFYGAENYLDFDQIVAADRVIHRPTFNYAVGAEYYVLPWLKARAGFFTNFSSHPDPTDEDPLRQPDRVDQYGFSANLSLVSSSKVNYTFGGYYTGGHGLGRQSVNNDLTNIKKSQQTYTMLVGTSFLY